MNVIDRFRGCLLGGAVGDALGAPVEFLDMAEIHLRFGDQGIGDYVPAYGKCGAITDDTQMALFTAEGLLRAAVGGAMHGLTSPVDVTGHAYLRWLETQSYPSPIEICRDGWLWGIEALHHARAPGNTCLSALKVKRSMGEPARNDSKGCGGVMRVAPVGLLAWHRRNQEGSARRCFDLAADLAGLTHGHPTGQWPAGVLAILVMRALDQLPIAEALREAKAILRTKPDHQETLDALDHAEILAAAGETPSPSTIETLGGGWVAEEALAIGVYCTLVAKSFEHGTQLAVNHSGDSDSTGSIAGNLLGAQLGVDTIPARWLESLELQDAIGEVAQDLHDLPNWNIGEYVTDGENERIWARYPGH